MSKALKELIEKSRQAVLAGNLDEAEKFKVQAVALKSVEDLDTPEAPEPKTVKRLVFGMEQPTDGNVKTTGDEAVKAWAAKRAYIKKFGEPDAAFEQIAKELYSDFNGDYYTLWGLKRAGLNHYLKTGQYDPTLSKVVLLSENQMAEAIITGVPMSAIKATMVEAQDTLGGFLVPEEYNAEITERLPGMVFMRRYADVRQTARDLYTVLRRTGGDSRYKGAVRVTKVDELPTSAASATNETFGKVQIPINTIMANVAVSRSLLEDSAVDLGTDLAGEFSSALAVFEDEQFLVGNGIGGPSGILKDNTTGGPNSVAGVTPTVVLNGDSTSIKADKIRGVPYKLDAQYRQLKAIWMMAKATREAIAMLKDSNNRYLLGDNSNLLAEGQQERLAGYGIEESEALPSVTANYFPAVFGDGKGYRIVDRIGMSVERYLDSNTAQTDSVIFYLRKRLGGAMTHPERFIAFKYA